MAVVIRRYRAQDGVPPEISAVVGTGGIVAISDPSPGRVVDVSIEDTIVNVREDTDEIMLSLGFIFVAPEPPVTSLDIAGALEVPPVNEIREGGGTALVFGAIADDELLKRVGTDVEGVAQSVFGNEEQSAVAISRVTTTSATPVAMLTLVTTALVGGTYRLAYECIMDVGTNNSAGSCQLQDITGAPAIAHGPVVWSRYTGASAGAERYQAYGYTRLVLGAGVRTYEIQFNSVGGGVTIGLAQARIELYRIA